MWAKASNKDDEEKWLPLTIHMSDSAKVAKLLWRNWVPNSTKEKIIDNIRDLAEGDDPCEFGEKLFVFLAAAHDIGKAIPAFQCSDSLKHTNKSFADIRRSAIECAGLRVEYFNGSDSIHHSLASQMILEENGFDRDLATILGGHHGKPPDMSSVNNYGSYPNHTGARITEWRDVQKELLNRAVSLSGMDINRLRAIKNLTIANQVILTGLVIMADWMASDESLFPYIEGPYFTKSDHSNRAERAWNELNLPGRWEAGAYWRSNDLFSGRFDDIKKVRPIQRAVEQAAKDMGKGIMIIEAPMGEGKTEAALVAAEILAEKYKLGGLFFALPTQATADGIFPRIKNWIDHISADIGENRSLFLAHGKSAFNTQYKKVKRRTQNVQGIDNRNSDNVIVHEWLDGRKKGLLSDFVIGTVDQILMAGLKQKHLALRHLALANKVVIIDEVHAYDEYMGSYLVKALRWLGAYNVPVILLSATLPEKRRKDLIDAYLRKKDKTGSEQWSSNSSYPLITCADDKQGVKQICAEASGRKLTVKIEKIADESLLDVIDGFSDEGGYIGIIVNTVGKAQKIMEDLTAKYGKESTYILHSRFVSLDRTLREKTVREMLSAKERLHGRRVFVVGTQVMEQSLDLDFDLLITDLCPMDLLLQRIGRLHRHENIRPEKLREAQCFVLDPKDGTFDKGSEAVYLKYHLMNTRQILPAILSLPDDIRNLVHSAYDPNGVDVPSELQDEYIEAKNEKDKLNEIKEGKAKEFQISDPRRGMNGLIDWLYRSVSSSSTDKKAEATVRDTEGSLEVIVIQKRKDKFFVLPLNDEFGGKEIPASNTPDPNMCFTLAGCKVALPYSFSAHRQLDRTIKDLEEDNQKRHHIPLCWQESSWLAGELFLILDENNSADISGKRLIYDSILGLREETQ